MQKKEMLPVIPSKDMINGNPEAAVRLVLFGDYESQETRAVSEIIKQLLEKYSGRTNFVFRHFPLTKIHQRAHKAAEAAIAAGQEGKFWQMHEQLMNHPHELGTISLKAHAREVGVQNKKFLDQLINSAFGWYVQDDIREGLSLGIKTIPALLINGQMIEGKLTQHGIEKLIRQELKNHSAEEVQRRA